MIVLDASAALAALLRDGDARRVLAGESTHVPHLADSEVASGLRRHAAAGRINEATAWGALTTWQSLGLIRHATRALLGRIWELRDNLSAYDAGYVALAEALDCPLVTADARLSRAPGPRCRVEVVAG